MLEYIENYINSYYTNINVLKISKKEEDRQILRNDRLYKILAIIRNNTLANDIIRYISSYFYIDKYSIIAKSITSNSNEHIGINDFIDNVEIVNEDIIL